MEVFAKPAVAGIIEKKTDEQDYILIQDRSKKNAPKEEGLIEIPAGRVREYENVYACLRREIYEETGLEVLRIAGEDESSVLELNGQRIMDYTPFSCVQCIDGNYPLIMQAFICRTKGVPLHESEESKNIRWISINELNKLLSIEPEMFYPMHVATIKRYIRSKGVF